MNKSMDTSQAQNDSRFTKVLFVIKAVESGLRAETGEAKKELSAEILAFKTDVASLKSILDARKLLTFWYFPSVTVTAVLAAVCLVIAVLAYGGDRFECEASYRGIVLEAQEKQVKVDASQDSRLDRAIKLLEESTGSSIEEPN